MKIRNILIFVFAMLSTTLHAQERQDLVLDQERKNSAQDVKRYQWATERLEAQIEWEMAKEKLKRVKSGENIVSDNSGNINDTSQRVGRGSSRPAWARGNPEYDSTSQTPEKKAVAYVVYTFGKPGDLSAEIFWNGAITTAKRHDNVIGGEWKVKSIGKTSVTLSNGRKTIILTGAKTDISSLI